MDDIIWNSPDVSRTQMDQFRLFVNKRFCFDLANYDDLYDWSVTSIEDFWESVWSFADIIHAYPASRTLLKSNDMRDCQWFPGAKLNFVDTVLRYRDDRPAIIARSEGRDDRVISFRDLSGEVARATEALRSLGVGIGDRVAGFIPNIPEAVIMMLASASVGAIWSSSSPDFGIKGVCDRFSQIEPKVLIAADGYQYGGKRFDSIEKLKDITASLPSIEQVIIVPFAGGHADLTQLPNALWYDDVVLPLKDVRKADCELLPFNHPLYIMYSSGTTGLPKSIVHGAGGTLLQHMKEHILHVDLTREDRLFYFTTCGWMMWNWLVTALAGGTTIVLYDGSPFAPDPQAMWRLCAELKVTVFGTSAKYLAACANAGVNVADSLPALRTILSTGSTLMDEQFDYIHEHIKKDVQISSISGGTDIISCFALGNPMLPVRRGEIQCRGLGMKVESYDENGQAVLNTKGELVCTEPFPSMPVGFWNDEDGTKYQEAYFDTYPGVWHHGDYIEIYNHGGVRIYGRSDATLNPGGVRIGTAEIYRVLESMAGIDDSLVIGQQWEGDERMLLFVKMAEGMIFDKSMEQQISTAIRSACSPRHVPAKMIPIADIPYTISGKKVEIAVKKIIHGEQVLNRDALANPEALDLFQSIADLYT